LLPPNNFYWSRYATSSLTRFKFCVEFFLFGIAFHTAMFLFCIFCCGKIISGLPSFSANNHFYFGSGLSNNHFYFGSDLFICGLSSFSSKNHFNFSLNLHIFIRLDNLSLKLFLSWINGYNFCGALFLLHLYKYSLYSVVNRCISSPHFSLRMSIS
jgi:hypothetical protein